MIAIPNLCASSIFSLERYTIEISTYHPTVR